MKIIRWVTWIARITRLTAVDEIRAPENPALVFHCRFGQFRGNRISEISRLDSKAVQLLKRDADRLKIFEKSNPEHFSRGHASLGLASSPST
eukprot:2850520-Pyramimonas_sp.AAC.1